MARSAIIAIRPQEPKHAIARDRIARRARDERKKSEPTLL
jgi:hypothetical protein